MNKLLTLATLSALSLTAMADDGASQMVFQFQDGVQQSIAAENLMMRITDGAIVADNGVMSLNIPLASLQQFYFSDNSGIGAILQDHTDWSIYNLEGKAMGRFSALSGCQGQLPAGIYVAKSAAATIKIEIR